jgi:formylglycine-generating enzyme required for sulfatase activity
VVWCNAYNELLAEIRSDSQKVNYPYVYGEDISNTTILEGDPIRSALSLPATLDWKNIVVSTITTATATYRLPTETEWEFAARGGAPGTGAWIQTYAGSNNVDTVAWWEGVNEDGVKHLVYEEDTETQKAKKPVTLGKKGVYHMSGNVWEWCLTDDSDFDKDSKLVGNGRIEYLKRGGGFNDNADACATSSDESKYIDSIDRYSDTGFRLVRTVTN